MATRANFNSIKVRLELPGGSVDTSSGQVFQFHKGTIRTTIKVDRIKLEGHFNSIKVRLEPLMVTPEGKLSAFQFHKGTIRTT